jgi:hypothetical protein
VTVDPHIREMASSEGPTDVVGLSCAGKDNWTRRWGMARSRLHKCWRAHGRGVVVLVMGVRSSRILDGDGRNRTGEGGVNGAGGADRAPAVS